MDLETVRKYCLNKKGATESFPFDEDTLVFKVGKMFLLADLVSIPARINLKCDPEIAVELREKFDSVIPGYHMSKKHWNTVILDNSIPDELILKWIDDSYDLIFASLSKKEKERINNLNE